MDVPKTLRIALLYDLNTWILSYIAQSMKANLEADGSLELVPMKAPRNRCDISRLRKHFHVIHFLSPGDFYRIAPACAMPSVVTVHHVASRVRERLDKLAHNADVVCYINRECEQELSQLDGLNRSLKFLTPMGVDLDSLTFNSSGRDELLALTGCPPETVFLGFSAKKNSNEDDRKGIDRYNALMEKLGREFGDKVKLVIFGPGKERPFGWRHEDFSEAIRQNIILPGFLPKEKLQVLYSGLDFYVCLSRIEGGPYPVMETMACQVKNISTRVGIVGDLIEDGVTGYLVDGDNYLDRIPDLIRALDHPPPEMVAMGKLARQVVEKNRSWKKCLDLDLYRKIYAEAFKGYFERSFTSRSSKEIRLFLAEKKKR